MYFTAVKRCSKLVYFRFVFTRKLRSKTQRTCCIKTYRMPKCDIFLTTQSPHSLQQRPCGIDFLAACPEQNLKVLVVFCTKGHWAHREYFANKTYDMLACCALFVSACLSTCVASWQYAFSRSPMTHQLLSPAQTLVFLVSPQISSPPSSPPPLSSLSPFSI